MGVSGVSGFGGFWGLRGLGLRAVCEKGGAAGFRGSEPGEFGSVFVAWGDVAVVLESLLRGFPSRVTPI